MLLVLFILWKSSVCVMHRIVKLFSIPSYTVSEFACEIDNRHLSDQRIFAETVCKIGLKGMRSTFTLDTVSYVRHGRTQMLVFDRAL